MTPGKRLSTHKSLRSYNCVEFPGEATGAERGESHLVVSTETFLITSVHPIIRKFTQFFIGWLCARCCARCGRYGPRSKWNLQFSELGERMGENFSEELGGTEVH